MSMDPRSEVILRQQHFLSGHILFIAPPADLLLHTLNKKIKTSVWTWNFADDQYFKAQDISVHFGVEFPNTIPDQVIIFTPKSKELLEYILHTAASHLTKGSSIFLVGEKKGGIERAAKQLQKLGKALKLDSARHCQLWQCQLEHSEPLKPLESWVKKYNVHVNDIALSIVALPGVFSQNHLDNGTAVLLPYLNRIKSGKLADFGCGAGIISAYLAALDSKNQIFALDIDAFALRSTEMTFRQNKLDLNQLQIQAVTGIQDAPQHLDALVSNPPFHQGIHTDYGASEGLCQHAKEHLNVNGELWIVANRFLNYASLIEHTFGRCDVLVDQQGFKVLYASVSGR